MTSVLEENNMGKYEQRAKQTNVEPSRPQKRRARSEELIDKQRILRGKKTKEKDTRQSTEKTCPMCQGGHFLVDCQKFQKTSVQDRWATVKKSHVCFKCLQGKHRKESCKKPPCKECKRWHHHLLHVESEDRTSGEKKAETQEEVASVMTSVNAVNNGYQGRT
ncbi:unnamed protein product [Parnassius apollo]|uniref:(apollo) hypothetical protein n=1 Tax=Parnassius apollo TaxID=110799 RepID=A0A8S3XNC2_PARAO|nr:unnamed protein product [Parnassius apollo]